MDRTLSIRPRQNLALTARLQHSVRLLQLSSLEFAQEISQALVSNPFLEEDDSETENGATAPAIPSAVSVADESTEVAAAPEFPSNEVDTPFDSDGAYEANPSVSEAGIGTSDRKSTRDDDPETDWTDWVEATPSLRDHLRNQLMLAQLGSRDRALAHVIIDALDEDGYLRQGLDEVAAALDEVEPKIEAEELRAALRMVQTLDPAGVAATSLAECLELQLDTLPCETEGLALARQIVRDNLPLVASRDVARLQRLHGCTEDDLRVALALIRNLDPRPGGQYAADDIRYIIPDVIVRKIKGKWWVTLNPAVLPRIRINRVYAEIFRRGPRESGAPLGQQLQEARWLIRNAEQRFATIQRVAEAIVERQRRFLEYGEIAMRPLALKQIADELGLHESTVSRVTNNKYMATPRGLFEFKHFFSRQLSTSSGGVCSATAIRALLKEMIDAEPAGKPLSDARLAEMLAEQGVRVARRTVTKYRRLMHLPNVELRRLS
jgi:RNA polymerase sigma-54 factor